MAEVEWRKSPGLVPYPEALAHMDERSARIRAGTALEEVWLLEHPPLYTAGTSARPEDLLEPGRLPIFPSGRGGQYTYHGPGQRIAYVMLDLAARSPAGGPDLRALVADLEEWLVRSLARFGVRGFSRQGRIGVWVETAPGREAKIAAIGLRVRRWVSLHGIALNVSCDLSHFAGIVPCGIREHGVTSLHALGVSASMDEVDAALKEEFEAVFRRPG